MPLLLGIDLGTSYFKAGLYEEDGRLRGLARTPTPITSPVPGRREMSPGAFWQSLHGIVSAALKQASAQARDISALSYSSQANTFLLLDSKRSPLTPIMVWQDTRALDKPTPLDTYRESDAFFQKTGIAMRSTGTMLGKLEWLRETQADLWEKTHHVYTLSDYLASTLLEKDAGDSGTAALTGLWDIPGDCRHDEAIKLAGIDPAWLPPLKRPGSPLGEIGSGGSLRLGLKPGIPLVAGSLDHHVAAIGSGLGRLAEASLSTGTVLAALRLSAIWQPRKGCYQGPDCQAGRFYSLVADSRGAGILEILRQRHAADKSFEELLDAVSQLPGDVCLPAIPDEAWDDPAPGYFQGLCLDKWQDLVLIARAVMENIAHRQRGLLEQLFDGPLPDTVIATGGGARSPLWLQMKVKALQARVLAPESAERACLGAAIFASVGAGCHRDVACASERMVKPGRTYYPE